MDPGCRLLQIPSATRRPKGREISDNPENRNPPTRCRPAWNYRRLFPRRTKLRKLNIGSMASKMKHGCDELPGGPPHPCLFHELYGLSGLRDYPPFGGAAAKFALRLCMTGIGRGFIADFNKSGATIWPLKSQKQRGPTAIMLPSPWSNLQITASRVIWRLRLLLWLSFSSSCRPRF
jgi:hypothetical protein